jgi:hypothetical protein
MGMDANINGTDVRFSGLLAEIAFERFPILRDTANNDGYIDIPHDMLAEIAAALCYRLDDMKITTSYLDGVDTLSRIREMQTGLFKAGTLIQWLADEENQNSSLCFA